MRSMNTRKPKNQRMSGFQGQVSNLHTFKRQSHFPDRPYHKGFAVAGLIGDHVFIDLISLNLQWPQKAEFATQKQAFQERKARG